MKPRREQRSARLDQVSRAIVEQLQQDGRRSYAAIGKAVGLSEAAVRQRVQRLLDSGVVRVVAVTDPVELGFRRMATIGVRVVGPVHPVADKLSEIDEVDGVIVTTGRFDLLLDLVAEDDPHLIDLVSSRIRNVPGVESTETFVHLKHRKHSPTWR